jgi:hypothetical protein
VAADDENEMEVFSPVRIAVAVAPRLHRDVGGVGAAAGFGDAECSEDLAAANRWQKLGLLARVAAAGNYRADQ